MSWSRATGNGEEVEVWLTAEASDLEHARGLLVVLGAHVDQVPEPALAVGDPAGSEDVDLGFGQLPVDAQERPQLVVALDEEGVLRTAQGSGRRSRPRPGVGRPGPGTA